MVVAHGAIYKTMLPAICTNAIDVDFVMDNGFDNTGYLKAELMPNGDLRCSEWNGTPIPGAK